MSKGGSSHAVIGDEKKRRRIMIEAVTKYQGRELCIPGLSEEDCVEDLKEMLEEATSIPRKRMKLVGLVKGRLPGDEVRLGALPTLMRKPQSCNIVVEEEEEDEEEVRQIKFTLMGTPDTEMLLSPEIARKEHESRTASRFAEEWYQKPENKAGLKAAINRTEINWIAKPRPGFPLLVLDLDHTLVDFKASDSHDTLCRRPYLDSFLTAAYQKYDIVIWSQTSWRWIELKVTEIGMLLNNIYKICFCIDKHAMLSVSSMNRRGRYIQHRVKPLDLIWEACPQWSPKNTIHIDDLARNFVLNPKNGLRCRPFHRDNPLSANDNELALLGPYLTQYLAQESDFTLADLSSWRTIARSIDTISLHKKRPPPTAPTPTPPPNDTLPVRPRQQDRSPHVSTHQSPPINVQPSHSSSLSLNSVDTIQANDTLSPAKEEPPQLQQDEQSTPPRSTSSKKTKHVPTARPSPPPR